MRHTFMKLSVKQFLLGIVLVSYLPCSLANNHNYYQVKLGGGAFQTPHHVTMAPVVSLGKRFAIGDCAVEVSTAWAENKHNDAKFSYFTLPKISYLQFHNPQAHQGFFYGGGLSYNVLKRTEGYYGENTKFNGVSGEATVGYEFQRKAAIHPAFYVDVSQPLVAQSREGAHPGPSLLLGMSVGF